MSSARIEVLPTNVLAINGDHEQQPLLPARSCVSANVKSIVLDSVREFSVLLTYSLVANHFLAEETPWYCNPLLFSLAVEIVNTAVRGKSTSCEPGRARFLMFSRAFPFAAIDTITRDPLIHESGHALAAYALYENADPRITIWFDGSGLTSFNGGVLSAAGKRAGVETSAMVVAAAGVLSSMTINYATLITAHFIPNKYEQIKAYMRMMAVASTLRHVIYALSAYDTVNNAYPGQDFHDLSEGGVISPGTAAFILLGSIAILQFGLAVCTAKGKFVDKRPKANVSVTDVSIFPTPVALEAQVPTPVSGSSASASLN